MRKPEEDERAAFPAPEEDLVSAPAPARRKLGWIVGIYFLAFLIHWTAPVGPQSWHWLHLFAQKLMFAPVLLAAAWFGPLEVFLSVLLVTAAFFVHMITGWSGFPMVQEGQTGELVSLWLLAPAAWLFFESERRSRRRLRKAHAETLLAIVSSMEMRESYTAGHSRRVAGYSALIAREMGIRSEAFLRQLSAGALLHDIGKIGVPDDILLKMGALSEEERRQMQAHSDNGARFVRDAEALADAEPIIAAHHERYGGQGYPRGLAGEEIPLGARIVAVADIYDAMTTARPYKPPVAHLQVLVFFRAERARSLDPEVVNAFCAVPFQELSGLAGFHGVTLRET